MDKKKGKNKPTKSNTPNVPDKGEGDRSGKGKKGGKKMKMNEGKKPNDTKKASSNRMDVDAQSGKSANKNVAYVIDPTSLDHRSVGKFLAQATPITLKILSYLSHGDLQNCARVCRNWGALVDAILQKRGGYEWFYAGSSLDDLKCLPERFAKFAMEVKIAPQIILGFEPPEAKFPTCDRCTATNRNKKKEASKNQKTERCKCIKNDYDKVYQCAFPKTPAGSFRITGYGVISSYLGEFHTLYTNEDNDFNQTTLLLPSCEGIEISSYLFKQQEVQRMTKPALTKILTGHDLAVKAILIYLTDSNTTVYQKYNISLVRSVVSILRKKQKTPAVSMGGGIVKKIRNTLYPNVSYQAAMFIFRGAKVSAYSTVIKETEASDICTSFMKMSEKVNQFPGKKLCFMTECTERQNLYISDDLDLCCNLETRCMNRYLPGVPTFGVWGHGEIGFTTPDENAEDEDDTPENAHAYATSLLFLMLEN